MSGKKKIPERRCVGCGEQRPKDKLMRIVCLPDGRTETDPTGKKPGRGAYICYDEKCLAKGMKRLSRSLSAEISADIAAELAERING